MLIKRICLIAIAAVALAAVFVITGMKREALSGVEGELVSEEELALNGGDLERAVRTREIWIWAAECGLTDVFSYDDFMNALKAENQNRKKLQEEGGVIYGPVEYTPLQYYRRLLGEYERLLRARILEETEPSELFRFYETHQKKYMDADIFEAEYTIQQNGQILYEGKVALEADNIRFLSESDEELVNHLIRLNEGERISWKGRNDEEKLLNCTRREKGRLIPYEEVKGAVADQYSAECFERELRQRLES